MYPARITTLYTRATGNCKKAGLFCSNVLLFFQNYNKPTVYADVGQSRCRFMAYLPRTLAPATSNRVPTPDVHRTDYPVCPFYRYTV